MLSVLKNVDFRKVFFAQLISLIGTGFTTIALGLLAYNLDANSGPLILGTIFSIKMISYVVVAPVSAGLFYKFPRKIFLILVNIFRIFPVFFIPFINDVWQVYVLVFLFQAATAAYTPTIQALIPEILTDEKNYTDGLSVMRITSDLENIASPIFAGLLLILFDIELLFYLTCGSFFISSLLISIAIFPEMDQGKARNFFKNVGSGIKIYRTTPRLKGLFSLSIVTSSVGAMVLVNTVFIVRSDLEMSESFVGVALAAFGTGSIVTASMMSKLLLRYTDRYIMLLGGLISISSLFVFGIISINIEISFITLLCFWFCVGLGYSAILTPSGRILTRSAATKDRTGLFATQFALSHLCWLITYPLAGALTSYWSSSVAMLVMPMVAVFGFLSAIRLWKVL